MVIRNTDFCVHSPYPTPTGSALVYKHELSDLILKDLDLFIRGGTRAHRIAGRGGVIREQIFSKLGKAPIKNST